MRTAVLHVTLYSILWSGLVRFYTEAAPVGRPGDGLFPQRPGTAPEKIQDGQSIVDKIFIMKMINYMEWDAVKRRGGAKSYPYLREYIYEGDIILTKDQVLHFVYPMAWPNRKRRRRRKRKLNVEVLGSTPVKKWDLPIEYSIDSDHASVGHKAIETGLRHWEDETCITFIERQSTTEPFLQFRKGDGCYSFIGKSNDGANPVFISEHCYMEAVVAHEIGHALGFWHEHGRGDRDMYVNVDYDNIIPGMSHNFQKLSWAVLDNLQVPYDIASVMHYNPLEFSIDNTADKVTIESKDTFLHNTMGQRLGLSFYDVKLANKAYCSDTCDPALLNSTCKYDGYQDPKNCSRCRCPDGLSGDICESVAPSDDGCGGEINLLYGQTYIIQSPGYPHFYKAWTNCFWLVKSPNGTIIKMKFSEPYMNSTFCQHNRQHLPCVDFVELRINDNLGTAGGRFCCDDAVQRRNMSQPIYTHSDHALILFKTIADGRNGTNGFQLHLSYETCGGCFSNLVDQQRPCYRHVTTTCYQTWQVEENVTATTNYTYPTVNDDIKTTVMVQKRRSSVCSHEEPYCCHDYVLTSDKLFCHVQPAPTPTTTTTPPPTSTSTTNANVTTIDDVTSAENEDDNVSDWTDWSAWSPCSSTCGGCGTKTRSRSCRTDASCVGNNTDVDPCGLNPCDTPIMIDCARKVITYHACGFFSGGTMCSGPPKMEYFSQPGACCCEYKLTSDDKACEKMES